MNSSLDPVIGTTGLTKTYAGSTALDHVDHSHIHL